MYDDSYFIDFYQDTRQIIDGITNKVSFYVNKSPTMLRWKDYKFYFEQVYHVEYYEYDFNSFLEKKFSGSIMIDHRYCTAAIGFNSSMILPRINFTQAHESGHFLESILDMTLETQSYTDLLVKNYSESNYKDEWFANIAAGMMLIEETSLIQNLRNRISFHSLCRIYGASQSAMCVRIKQLFQMGFGVNRFYVENAVTNYKDYDNFDALIDALNDDRILNIM
ncbi:hypothetical protein GKC32_09520 [Lactobacillus curvatus]|nr:hypothetical protein [Latilactobacillus curvatus]MSD84805.1 hypothetical protein [Latilactobacillus curvatus]MSE24680.1 hypothetical protein [Latilactobacillus curvatus]